MLLEKVLASQTEHLEYNANSHFEQRVKAISVQHEFGTFYRLDFKSTCKNPGKTNSSPEQKEDQGQR